jgi:hypothetical protein
MQARRRYFHDRVSSLICFCEPAFKGFDGGLVILTLGELLKLYELADKPVPRLLDRRDAGP